MGIYASKITSGVVMHTLTVFFCYLCAVLLILLLSSLFVNLIHFVIPFSKVVFGAGVLVLTVFISAYGFIVESK